MIKNVSPPFYQQTAPYKKPKRKNQNPYHQTGQNGTQNPNNVVVRASWLVVPSWWCFGLPLTISRYRFWCMPTSL